MAGAVTDSPEQNLRQTLSGRPYSCKLQEPDLHLLLRFYKCKIGLNLTLKVFKYKNSLLVSFRRCILFAFAAAKQASQTGRVCIIGTWFRKVYTGFPPERSRTRQDDRTGRWTGLEDKKTGLEDRTREQHFARLFERLLLKLFLRPFPETTPETIPDRPIAAFDLHREMMNKLELSLAYWQLIKGDRQTERMKRERICS